MLSEPSIISKTEINQKTDPSRFEELMTNYEDPVRATVHRLLEEYVEKAFIEFMEGRTGAVIRRSTDGKPIKDYRNGYRDIKQVPIDTMLLQGFRVLSNRVGGFRSDILPRMKRRAGKLASLALELFVHGMGTRRVRRAFERIGVKVSGLSKSTVSEISKDLLKEYLCWINRPISRPFAYLQVDGVYVTIRKSSTRKAGTLIVIGITEDGHKEVLHFTLGTESEKHFDEVLQSLISRGLNVKRVKLVTADGARGPNNSIVSHLGRDTFQRCVVHKTRNILAKCPKNIHDELKAKVGRLWNQSSRLNAEQYLERLRAEYEAIAPRALECLLEDKEDLLRFFGLPDRHFDVRISSSE